MDWEKKGAEWWKEHMLKQARSEKNIKDYCQDNGIKLSCFYDRRRRNKAKTEDTEKKFERIDIKVDKANREKGISIITPNGFKIELKVTGINDIVEICRGFRKI